MLYSRARRAVAVLLLLAVLFGFLVGYGALSPAPALGAYPTTDALATDYEAQIDRPVLVTGTVEETRPVVIAAEYVYASGGTVHAGTLELTIKDVSSPIRAGQLVQVFGVARPDRTIAARNVVTIPRGNFQYMYTVSALAGLWVLMRLIVGWHVDLKEGVLRPRSQQLRVMDRIETLVRKVLN